MDFSALVAAGLVRIRVRVFVEHELVRQKEDDSQREDGDDPAIEFLARLASDRFVRRDFALELQALGRPLVEPREDERERKTNYCRDHDPAHDPFGNMKQWKDLCRDLHQEPRPCGIERSRADDVAAFEFSEEGHRHVKASGPS